MVIIDVGACIGEYTDHCLKTYDVDKIIMVEPLTVNVEHLREKYKDLIGSKVFIIEGAVSDYNGPGKLYPKIKTKRLPEKDWQVRKKDAEWLIDNDPGLDENGNPIHYSQPQNIVIKIRKDMDLIFAEELDGWQKASNYAGNAGSVLNMTQDDITINNDVMNSFYQAECRQHVGVCTISWLFEKFNIEHVDILKLDVEGCEYKILKDIFDRGTYKNIDKILFEDHSEKREGMQDLRKNIFEKIKELNIEDKFWIQEEHLTYDVPLVEADMWKEWLLPIRA